MLYRAAVIGCGRIGAEFDYTFSRRNFVYSHAGAYKLNYNKVSLDELCDIDEEKAKKAALHFNVSHITKDYKHMLCSLRPDIVSICTKPEERLEIIKECIANQVQAIYCEKPLADNLENAKKIYDLVKSNNIIFIVNHQRRFSEFHKKMKDIIDNHLGDIQNVVCYYSGGIYNTGTHVIDLLRTFFGEPSSCLGRDIPTPNSSDSIRDPVIEGDLFFYRKETNGFFANFIDMKNPKMLEIIISGSKGRLFIGNPPYTEPLYLTNGDIKAHFRFEQTKENRKFDKAECYSQSDLFWSYEFDDDYMTNAVRHIVRCLDEKAQNNISTVEDGYSAMKIIDTFIKSAAEKHRMTLDA